MTKELTENLAAFDTIKDVIRTICESDVARFKSLPPLKAKGNTGVEGRTDEHNDITHSTQVICHTGPQVEQTMHGYFLPDSRSYLVCNLVILNSGI